MIGGPPIRDSSLHGGTATQPTRLSLAAWLATRVLAWLLAPWIVFTSLALLTLGHLPSPLADNALFAQAILAMALSALLGWASLRRLPKAVADAPRLPPFQAARAIRLTGILSGLAVSLALGPYLLGILEPAIGDAWMQPAAFAAIWLSPLALFGAAFVTFFLRCANCGRRALTVAPNARGAACRCRRCGAVSADAPVSMTV